MTEVDVLVIGAGLAGLRAGVDLADAGRDVVVVEARDRVGGRVWSHAFDNGQWCERGAEFIDTDHAVVLDLVTELGLRLTDVRSGHNDETRWLDVSGRTAPFALHHSLLGELERWHEAIGVLAAAVNADDPYLSPRAAELDALRLSDIVNELQLSPMARVVVGREVRSEFMLGPDEISQLMAGWMTALHLRSGEGREAYRIEGGNDLLAHGLAAKLGERVRLSLPVDRIDPDTGEVFFVNGDIVRASHLIVTVPLPVLGRMWVDMPHELAAVSYGIGGKVSVQTTRRIWNDHGCDGTVITERAWGQMWETSEDQPGDSGVLTILLTSHDGAALAALPDTTNRVIDETDRLFPGFKAMSGERVQTDWTNDRYSLGCYATFGPNEFMRAWPLMQRRYGRMVLAGEHTDACAGFMEGALRSGRRAAALV